MTSRDFCYWLQGYFEIAEPKEITGEQLKTVQRHLAMVFVHEIDPSMGDDHHQSILDHIHNGPKTPPPHQDENPELVKFRC